MSFVISSTAYRANRKHVEEEIIYIDPRDADRLGSYRLRRVIETPGKILSYARLHSRY
jgi:hypothetical protein